MTLGQHTSHQYDNELEEAHSMILSMGGMVERQLGFALKSLLQNDSESGQEAVNADGAVDEMEMRIDETCAQIIARRQPKAVDLRLLLMLIKSVTDLERIGDESTRVARSASNYSDLHHADIRPTLREMAEKVQTMLHDSLDAIARMDAKKALAVKDQDDDINALYSKLTQELLHSMQTEPDSLEAAMDAIWCSRSLERIGDHCKNLCQHVVYTVEGIDIRHGNEDDL